MNKIKELRKEKNITVAELAKELGISQSMLTNYENGNGTPRDESIWEKLSQIFGVSKSHVMGLTTDIETANKTRQLKVVVDTSQPISIQPKNQTDLDVLIKLDLIDSEDMEEVSAFLDKLLAQEKYEGHVACNNTKDSQELARHAESLGVDAIAAIPPIYFHLPEYAIAQYWNDISAAAPNTDFVIYNIPQLAGVALTQGLFAEMRKNPNVIGVKNSSMPVQDIQMFKQAAGPDYIIFNGPDEQFMSGRVIGAEGAIGGTYGVMPELYLKLDEYVRAGKMEEAREIQYACDEIIYKMCSAHGNMYAVIKAILKINEGLELGGVKEPLPGLIDEDSDIVKKAAQMICDAKKKYL